MANTNDIVIKEVVTKCDIRKFVKFQWRLFKDVPTYLPPLMLDEMTLLTKKNPSLEYCSLKMWMAYRDRKPVGRVAAIINPRVNETWNKKQVRFGWFDFIEDFDVCRLLLDKVIEYGKQNGMTTIEGPFGFNDMDKECWMIDNFDCRQNPSTLYNPEYYIRFIEQLGYEIKCRWQQYKVPASQPVPDKVARLNDLIMKKYDLRILRFKKRKEIMPYAYKFFDTLGKSFSILYDYVPLTPKETKYYIGQYFPFLDVDFTNLVVDKDDNIVAFGVSLPSLTEAYKRANGRLLPFGWFYLLRALKKYDTIDLMLNGVHPDWQKRGVHAIYYAEMNRNAIRHHVGPSYSNPQIIGNEAEKIWRTTYEATPLVTRAVFGKDI